MKKIRIKIVYDGKLNAPLDVKILDAMAQMGCKWYASGYDYEADVRDHCFDYFEEEEDEKRDGGEPDGA